MFPFSAGGKNTIMRKAPAVFKKNSVDMITRFNSRVKSFLCLLAVADLVGVNLYAGAHGGGKNAGADILTL